MPLYRMLKTQMVENCWVTVSQHSLPIITASRERSIMYGSYTHSPFLLVYPLAHLLSGHTLFRHQGVSAIARAEMLPLSALTEFGGLPTTSWCSDHMALIGEFKFDN